MCESFDNKEVFPKNSKTTRTFQNELLRKCLKKEKKLESEQGLSPIQ